MTSGGYLGCLEIAGHPDADFNGMYCRVPDWTAGAAHLAKHGSGGVATHHLCYVPADLANPSLAGAWVLDANEEESGCYEGMAMSGGSQEADDQNALWLGLS